MSRIIGTATALPPHEVVQSEARRMAAEVYRGHAELERLLVVFDRTGVERRHLVHPLEWYAQERGFEERNARFVEQGTALGERVARECLDRSKTSPTHVDHVILATTTGLATPSLDASIAARLGMRADVRRSPLFGLGCAGGAAALARAADHCRAYPKQRALVVSVEICSAVFSTRATTPTDLVGAALFGDGASAALVAGDEVAAAGPRILFSRTHLFAGAEGLMGWNFTADGMRLVLSREVPQLVRDQLRPVVEKFLLEYGLSLGKIRHFLLHPGGPKVLEAYRDTFGLEEAGLEPIRKTMRDHGNLSSSAVLFLLHDSVASGRTRAGEKGILVALGPGFAAEMLLLGW